MLGGGRLRLHLLLYGAHLRETLSSRTENVQFKRPARDLYQCLPLACRSPVQPVCIRIRTRNYLRKGSQPAARKGISSPEELINVISDPPVISPIRLAESPKFSSEFLARCASQRRRVIRNRRRHATRHVRVLYCQICLKKSRMRGQLAQINSSSDATCPAQSRQVGREPVRQVHHRRGHTFLRRANGPMQLRASG